MSTNPSESERPHNPTHFGGEGLYEESSVAEAGPLKAPLGDQLDSATRQALESGETTSSPQSFMQRYRIPTLLVMGAVAGLLVMLARRSQER